MRNTHPPRLPVGRWRDRPRQHRPGVFRKIAKSNGCYSCHAAAEKIVGPAFNAVAEKYAGDKDAGSATLAQSIQIGSKGKWGRAAMPAHSSLSAQDLKLLAGWVLASKP